MKKPLPSPLYIVLASALYFFIASVLLSLDAGIETNLDNNYNKYYTSGGIGSSTMMSAVVHARAINTEKNYSGIISNR